MKKFIALLLIISFGSMFIMDVHPMAHNRDNEGKYAASFVTTIENFRLSGQYEKKCPANPETTYHNTEPVAQCDYYDKEILEKCYLSIRDDAAGQGQTSYKPVLSDKKIKGELAAGIAGGIALGIIVGLIATSSYHFSDEDSDMEALAFILGYIPGSIFGSAVGVSLAGNSRNIRGSFLNALVGSLLGTAASFLTMLILPRAGGYLAVGFFLTFPTIGAMALFNSSLRYKSFPGNALLNFDKSKFYIGVPGIQIQPQFHFAANEKRSFMMNLNLMNITF